MECEKRGIKVISLRGETEFLETITSTAEHTIGLIIALLRKYKTALGGLYKYRDSYTGEVLNGKTLGIIGYGRVGQQVRSMVEGLGMNILTYDKYNAPASLSSLLRESDIVTLHIPLMENEEFFTKEMFKLMKSTACLVNTSRGNIIEKGALIWALEEGL